LQITSKVVKASEAYSDFEATVQAASAARHGAKCKYLFSCTCMYAASKSKRAIKQMKGNYHQENELLSPELFFWREKKIYMRRQYGKESFFNRTFRL
jgi:hypothetical protein